MRLIAAGLLVELGCVWIWVESARLTALYNADYTRAFFAAAPWLSPLADRPVATDDAADMAQRLVSGLLLMSLGYLLAIRPAARSEGWLIVAFAALFRLTLALLPGLFSTDIFSYVMYGRVAAIYSANPYVMPPSAFGDDAFLSWVFPFWRDAPSVYGPLWTDLSLLLSRLTADWSPFQQTLAYRFVIIGFGVATLGLLWWVLTMLRTTAGWQAWLLFAWNPLVLFDLVGASHNDAAMLALLLLGIGLVVSAHWLAGMTVLALSALVKYATALVVLTAAVGWAARGSNVRQRVPRLALGLGVPLVLAVGLWWPWLGEAGALGPIEQAAGGRLVLNSAPDVLALTVASLTATDVDAARFWVRLVARVVFVGYGGWELYWLWRAGGSDVAIISASTRLLLVLPLLVMTWVWSWYFSWSLALAVLLGWRSWLTRLVVAYSLVALPVIYAHQYLNEQLAGVWVVLMALAPLAVLVGIRRSPALVD